MPYGASGLARVFTFVFLSFAPVLLAVIAVENRGPREGRARILWLAAALVIGQAIGTILWAIAIPLLYPDGYLVRWLGPLTDPVERLRHYGGNGFMYLATSAMVTCFYFLLKRDTAAAAALHQEKIDRE
jgi:peptidoglycan biosynthesis protein MviN/MurJ (putative lipid II flippase)